MRALSAAELMTVWECGADRRPVECGLVLLVAACPDETAEQILDLTVGQRDLRLARLREATFGAGLDCQAACPACGQRLELSLSTSTLLAPEPAPIAHGSRTLDLVEDGWAVRIRPIDTRDLISAVISTDAAGPRQLLLDRIVLGCRSPEGVETDGVPEAGLPAAIETAVFASMETIDRGSAVAIGLTCPECAHAWTAPFDIVSFFWREIEGWVQRTLREVHVLASAYGWAERDILALSAWRRDEYLRLMGHA